MPAASWVSKQAVAHAVFVAVFILLQVLQECCMSAADLAASVCGCTADDAADFNVQEAFCVVLEDEVDDAAASSSAVTCQSLWKVVGGWDVDQKRAFVKFVTGTGRWGHACLCSVTPHSQIRVMQDRVCRCPALVSRHATAPDNSESAGNEAVGLCSGTESEHLTVSGLTDQGGCSSNAE